MIKLTLASALMLAGLAAVATPSAQAANARNPYGNVDKRNDKGNNTGDAQVERLNAMQLDRARGGTGMGMGAMPGQAGVGMGLGKNENGNQSGNMSGTDR